MNKIMALVALLTLVASQSFALIANFDSKPSGTYQPTVGGNQDWTDGGASFSMTEDLTWGYYWEGIVYSDVHDTTTPGYGNQYAVYGDGLDYSDSGSYGVVYDGYSTTPTISFNYDQTVNGFYANNTTYAALAMLNGEAPASAFTTDDWFKLTITGKNSSGTGIGTVEFFLADFTGYTDGADKEEYMTTDWTWVDCTSLGDTVRSLEFTLSSSDNGDFGMNTPAYFAMDELQAVPEPASALLIALGSLGITGYRRWIKQV